MSETKSNQNLIIVNSLEEAEKYVYKLTQENKNPREISQIGFSINGVVKRFNPVQISKIKAKFEPKIPENNRDQDKSRVFSLFKKNKTLVEVIILTGLSYEYVKKSYQEYLEFEKMKIVPNWFEEYMYNLASEIKDCSSLVDVYHTLQMAIQSHHELQNHIYYCCVCGENMLIRGKSLQYACDYLSQKWGHAKCIKN